MKQIILILLLMFTGCSVPESRHLSTEPREDKRIRILKAEGLTDISLTGTPFFVCGDDDSMLFNTGFKGKKNGIEVEGALCGAMFKAWTVRYR